MCGRFVQFSSLRTLESCFKIENFDGEVVASYNIAPTQEILAVVYRRGRRLEKFRWGLVPSWSKDLSGASRLINARAETVAKKPSFRSAFKRRRCLILTDGFYEWKGEKGKKQPYFIVLPSGRPFAFAGLWEIWRPKDAPSAASAYKSCTILTTESSASIRDIHHRMPVILQPQAYERWLNPEIQEIDQLQQILQREYICHMKSFAVSTYVNRVENNSPACIQPISNH